MPKKSAQASLSAFLPLDLGGLFMRGIVASLILLGALGAIGQVHGHEVVDGPFGAIVDHQKPFSFRSDDERVRYARQQQMRAFSAHFRTIEASVKYGAPFDGLIAANAASLENLGQGLAELFRPEVPMESGRHGAKSDIWSEPSRFALHVKGFQAAASNLRQATNDRVPLAAPLQAMRHQCLACHQSFRVFAPR